MKRFLCSALLLFQCVLLIKAEDLRPAKYSQYVSADGGGDYMLNAMRIYDNLLGSYACWHVGASWGVSRLPHGDFFDYAFNYPEYGVRACYTATGSLQFKNNSSLSDLFSLQGFFKPNFYRNDIFSIGPFLSLGLTYTSRTWDPENNPSNKYVGTPVLVCLGVGMEARVWLSRCWSLALQAGLSHRSNGMMRVPNWGLNNVEALIALRYHIQPLPRFRREARPECEVEKKWLYDLYLTGGVHACDKERAIMKNYLGVNDWVKSYARLNLGTTVSYRYHPVCATGVGADIFYTGNWKRLEECSRIIGENEKCCPVYAGIYLQQTFFYRHLELGLGLGVYVFKKLGPEDMGFDYQRVSLRYCFEKAGILAGIGLRAHKFDRSDTIEFTLGKRF